MSKAIIMAAIFAPSNKHSTKLDPVSCLRTRLTTKAPKAPIPPASVGVKTPPYIPPITSKNSKSTGQVSLSDPNFCLMVDRGKAGPKSGLNLHIM